MLFEEQFIGFLGCQSSKQCLLPTSLQAILVDAIGLGLGQVESRIPEASFSLSTKSKPTVLLASPVQRHLANCAELRARPQGERSCLSRPRW